MPEGPIEAQLLDHEKQYWQAIKDKDIDAIMRLTDNPCIVTGAQGIGSIDHNAFKGMMKAAPWSFVSSSSATMCRSACSGTTSRS